MKNPLKHLKHMWKDPINTIDEANARKKEILPWLFGSIGVAALGAGLSNIEGLGFLMILGFVGVVVAMVFGFMLFVVKKAKEKFTALTCDKCHTLAEIKTEEDFAKYVSYTVETDEAIFKGYVGNEKPTDGVYSLVKYVGTSKAVVSVSLTCPHCGEVKHLKYYAEPFRCHAEAKKVGVLRFQDIASTLKEAVKSAVDDYNDPEKKRYIPYSIASSNNPHYEERTTFKGANSPDAHPTYNGARIDIHVDVDEMLEHYFVLNEINGTLSDPSKSKKEK